MDDVSLDVDPLVNQALPPGSNIYLPIIIKPTLTDLYVQNNVGKTLNLTINGVGSRSIPPGSYHWGTFPAGTYSWSATASGFAPASGMRTFPAGTLVWSWGAGSSMTGLDNVVGEDNGWITTLTP